MFPAFGDKEFDGVGFPTPSLIPDDTTCRTLQIPANGAWQAVVMGALLALTYPENWQQFEGAITREEAAERAVEMIFDAYALAETEQCGVDVPTPFWDDDDAEDSDDVEPADDQDWYGILVGEATWQEQIEDWVIAGFLAYAGLPGAAIQFLTVAPKFRLLFKSQDWGAIVKIFIDAEEYAEVDTYSEIPGIVSVDVTVPPSLLLDASPALIWIENSGTHNVAATPDADGQYRAQVIRKRLYADEVVMPTIFRQNPEDICQMQYSIDDGENWSLAFDYGLCMPPGIGSLLEIVVGGITIINPAAPTITWTSQEGDTDEQREARTQALCYAANVIVTQMCETILAVISGQMTLQNIAAVTLGLAATIIGIFITGVSVGALTALGMAIAAAGLAIASELISIGAAKFEDEDTRAAMACLLFQNLMNQPVSLAAMQEAFSRADCLTGDEQEVAGVLNNLLNDPAQGEKMYDAFVALMGDASSAALLGVLGASCVCDAATWCNLWDFANGLQGWTIINGTLETTGIEYAQNTVTIYASDDCSTADWGAVAQYEIYIPEGVEVTQILVDFTTAYSTHWSQVWVDGTCNFSSGSVHAVSIMSGFHTVIIAAQDNSGGVGQITINSTEWSGTGLNPFALCDNC